MKLEVFLGIALLVILLILAGRIIKGTFIILGNYTLLGILILIFFLPGFIVWAIYESYKKEGD